MISEVLNEDCLIGMALYPDKFFDLAVVDPPYGIGFGEFNRTNTDSAGNRYKANKYKQADWDDEKPNTDYFKELMRVSKDQIVWGGNYFPDLWLNGCKGFIFWYKGNPVPNFSDGELAWTSFNKVAKQFDYRYYGSLEGKTSASDKIHPTQKPIALYDWIYKNYLPNGGKVIDTHLGSGSNRIAADKAGNIDFYGWELDKDYYEAQETRWKNYKAQLKLFP